MRHLLALALLFGSGSAYAAPVPKELRKVPVEKEPENLLAQLRLNQFNTWQIGHRIDMPLHPPQDKLVNGVAEPKK